MSTLSARGPSRLMTLAAHTQHPDDSRIADPVTVCGVRNVELSVVVITKDQAWNIERLLSSVFREAAQAGVAPQVIVVDSASVDGVVECAMRWDVEIVRLEPDQPLSASMGRYAGYLRASGEFLLFLDGDMELLPGWLAPALHNMRQTPAVAAMDGQRLFVSQECADPRRCLKASNLVPGQLKSVRHIGGAAGLYRRQALERSGGFNPYLISDEEPDLGLRMRAQGYQLLRTQGYVGVHYGDKPDEISTLLRRRRRKLYYGFGQNLRVYWGTPLFRGYIHERGFWIPGAVLLATAAAVIGIRDLPSVAKATLLLPVAVAGAVTVVSGVRRGWRRTAFSIIMRLVVFEGAVRGLFLPLRTPDRYPIRKTTLKCSSLSLECDDEGRESALVSRPGKPS